MHIIKCLLVNLFIIISLSAFSQNTNAVFLKWKLKPNEVLSYKTTMEEIDTANHKDFDMSGMSKLMFGASKDSDSKKLFTQLNKMAVNSNFITHLKENKNNVIDVELFMKKDSNKSVPDTTKMGKSLNEMQVMMAKATSGVMLRGAINEEGNIVSFYTKGEQKNMIAMFFELPGKPVKIGDTWPLSINLISLDQNFKCDSSYKRNNVTVIDINSKNNEHIVTLKYDIIEYVNGNFNSPFNNSSVKTSMKMTYQAIAGFSLERGRWIAYDGIMSLSSSGIMTSQTTKKFSLVEE